MSLLLLLGLQRSHSSRGGQGYDAIAVDLWAVGVITFRLLTGMWPFGKGQNYNDKSEKVKLLDGEVRNARRLTTQRSLSLSQSNPSLEMAMDVREMELSPLCCLSLPDP